MLLALHLGCQLTDSTSLENFRTHSLTLSGWFHKINFWYFFCCDRNRKVILGHTWIEYARIASHRGAWWEQLCSHCWTNDVLLKVWTIILIVRERSAWVDFKIQNSYWVFIWIFRLTCFQAAQQVFYAPCVNPYVWSTQYEQISIHCAVLQNFVLVHKNSTNT